MTTQNLDAQLLLLINLDSANPVFDILMPLLSYQGYLLVIPFLVYMLIQGFLHKDGTRKRYLATAVSAIALACLAVYISDWAEHFLKNAIARPRPCKTLDGIRLLLPCPKSFSMPSGHAASSFAFALPLFYLSRPFMTKAWRMFPPALAALIAISRLYLGVHYPTDVLAGALLGSVIALALSLPYRMVVSKEVIHRD